MRRTVILGHSPSHNESALPWSPETGSGRRLADLVGVAPAELARHFDLRNLVAERNPSREALRQTAHHFVFDVRYRYVLAGTEIARAFGTRALPIDGTHASRENLRWYLSREGVRMAILPHPCRLNRWYNDEENRRAAEKFLRRCLVDDERRAA